MYEYASSADSSGGVACPAGTQEGDNLRFSPSCESSAFPWRARRKSERRDRSEKGNGRGFFLPLGSTVCSHSPAYTQCQILCCYTCGSVSAGATYPCRATLWHVATEGTCEFRYSVQFIFVGPVCNNVLTNRAALLCRTQRRFNRMCSSNLSDTANMRIHGRAKRVLR